MTVLDDLRTQALAASPGDRLPSVRELCARHRVGPATVQRAVSTLVAEGLAIAHPGRGTFVAEPAGTDAVGNLDWQSVALGPHGVDPGGLDDLLDLPRDGMISLSSGFLDQTLQPLSLLARAAGRAARRDGAWRRLPVEGAEELRSWFALELGGGHTAADVIVTSGGQSAIGVAFRALGRPGDPVLVESPTYLGALAAARGAGLVPIPVPVDAEGVRVDLLERALAKTDARLVYLQPLHANPTGSGLAAERRPAVLAAAARAGAFILEDDYARDLTFEGPAAPPLATADPDGHVVYLRSLTKSAAPGLRIGMIGARGAVGHRLRAARVVEDFFVSGLLQGTVLELVAGPGWTRHLRRLAIELTARRDTLLAAVEENLPSWDLFTVPKGGLGAWFRVGDDADELALVNDAADAGVQILPGLPWFAADPPAAFVRLSYAGADAAGIREGVRRLAGSARR